MFEISDDEGDIEIDGAEIEKPTSFSTRTMWAPKDSGSWKPDFATGGSGYDYAIDLTGSKKGEMTDKGKGKGSAKGSTAKVSVSSKRPLTAPFEAKTALEKANALLGRPSTATRAAAPKDDKTIKQQKAVKSAKPTQAASMFEVDESDSGDFEFTPSAKPSISPSMSLLGSLKQHTPSAGGISSSLPTSLASTAASASTSINLAGKSKEPVKTLSSNKSLGANLQERLNRIGALGPKHDAKKTTVIKTAESLDDFLRGGSESEDTEFDHSMSTSLDSSMGAALAKKADIQQRIAEQSKQLDSLLFVSKPKPASSVVESRGKVQTIADLAMDEDEDVSVESSPKSIPVTVTTTKKPLFALEDMVSSRPATAPAATVKTVSSMATQPRPESMGKIQNVSDLLSGSEPATTKGKSITTVSAVPSKETTSIKQAVVKPVHAESIGKIQTIADLMADESEDLSPKSTSSASKSPRTVKVTSKTATKKPIQQAVQPRAQITAPQATTTNAKPAVTGAAKLATAEPVVSKSRESLLSSQTVLAPTTVKSSIPESFGKVQSFADFIKDEVQDGSEESIEAVKPVAAAVSTVASSVSTSATSSKVQQTAQDPLPRLKSSFSFSVPVESTLDTNRLVDSHPAKPKPKPEPTVASKSGSSSTHFSVPSEPVHDESTIDEISHVSEDIVTSTASYNDAKFVEPSVKSRTKSAIASEATLPQVYVSQPAETVSYNEEENRSFGRVKSVGELLLEESLTEDDFLNDKVNRSVNKPKPQLSVAQRIRNELSHDLSASSVASEYDFPSSPVSTSYEYNPRFGQQLSVPTNQKAGKSPLHSPSAKSVTYSEDFEHTASAESPSRHSHTSNVGPIKPALQTIHETNSDRIRSQNQQRLALQVNTNHTPTSSVPTHRSAVQHGVFHFETEKENVGTPRSHMSVPEKRSVGIQANAPRNMATQCDEEAIGNPLRPEERAYLWAEEARPHHTAHQSLFLPYFSPYLQPPQATNLPFPPPTLSPHSNPGPSIPTVAPQTATSDATVTGQPTSSGLFPPPVDINSPSFSSSPSPPSAAAPSVPQLSAHHPYWPYPPPPTPTYMPYQYGYPPMHYAPPFYPPPPPGPPHIYTHPHTHAVPPQPYASGDTTAPATASSMDASRSAYAYRPPPMPDYSMPFQMTFDSTISAANDILRRQVLLIKESVERSRYITESQFAPAAPYKYTTLEDTKEFIARFKPRTLTMKEALDIVRAVDV